MSVTAFYHDLSGDHTGCLICHPTPPGHWARELLGVEPVDNGDGTETVTWPPAKQSAMHFTFPDGTVGPGNWNPTTGAVELDR